MTTFETCIGAADEYPPDETARTDAEAVRVLNATSAGEWLAADQLQMLAVTAAGVDIAVNVAGVDHLDAGSLQLLLALESAQKNAGRKMHVVEVSASLRRWFQFAGAEALLEPEEVAHA